MTVSSPVRPRRAVLWAVLIGAAVILASVVLVGTLNRANDAQADAHFVAAMRSDDPQAWVRGMDDAALADSGRTECRLMRAGADPQSRIDFYTAFNGAYLVNDAMTYLCPDQLAR